VFCFSSATPGSKHPPAQAAIKITATGDLVEILSIGPSYDVAIGSNCFFS